jgi:hypothetical protein
MSTITPVQSDIDFIAILSRKASSGNLKYLKKVHYEIERCFPKWKIDPKNERISKIILAGLDCTASMILLLSEWRFNTV